MKKMLSLVFAMVLILAIVPSVGAAAEVPPPPPEEVQIGPWHEGVFDPLLCWKYLDCGNNPGEVPTPVCYQGVTYAMPVYYDPSLMTPEEIEADAYSWSKTELTAGACSGFEGYEIPHLILYTSKDLINGYGLIVSTEAFANVDSIMGNFNLAAIPEDLVQVCEGPVVQMNANDLQGSWACDSHLVGILPDGRTGGRLPLISKTENSLQKVYENILAGLE